MNRRGSEPSIPTKLRKSWKTSLLKTASDYAEASLGVLPPPKREKTPEGGATSPFSRVSSSTKHLGRRSSHTGETLRFQFGKGPDHEHGATALNVALLGTQHVGKTAIAVRFVTKRFLHEYDPLLERCYQRNIELDSGEVVVKLWDTVGTPWQKFRSLVDGYAVVYSITDKDSFHFAQQVVHEMNAGAREPAINANQIVLVGNKIDLEHARQVSRSAIERYCADSHLAHIEVSAALNHRIEDLFRLVATGCSGKNRPPGVNVDNPDTKRASKSKNKILSWMMD